MRQLVTALLLAAVNAAAAQGNLYYGGDLDQEHAQDKAKEIGDKFRTEGYKTGLGSNIGAEKMCDDLKADLADEFNGDKLKCNNGVFAVYVSAHGTIVDGKSAIINPQAGNALLLSDWANWVVSTIPECCTLVFALDACVTRQWWDANFAGGEPKESSPFRNINAVIALPTADDRCPGTPVGDAIKAGFGTRRTASEYGDYLGGQPGVKMVKWLDDDHKDTIVTVPEPGLFVAGTAAFALVLRRRRT